MTKYKMAIQCKASTGVTGSFLFAEKTEEGLHIPVSPVFESVALLAPWMKANGYRPTNPGSLLTDYVKS